MPHYKIEPLNGLLTKASSCVELLEAIVPLAERILAELEEVTPRLFFATQDGGDGLLCFEPEAIEGSDKDDLAHTLRWFCAANSVRAKAERGQNYFLLRLPDLS